MIFMDGYSHETPLKKGIASEARGGPAACGDGGGGEETRAAANVPRRSPADPQLFFSDSCGLMSTLD